MGQRDDLIEYFDLPTGKVTAGITLKGKDLRDSCEAFNYLSEVFSVRREKIFLMSQVHGPVIRELSAPSEGNPAGNLLSGTDGMLFTGDPAGCLLGVRVADCMPVIILHKDDLLGMFHAGWRGISSGIGSESVRMIESKGLLLKDITYIAGPYICGDCFRIGAEVAERLPAAACRGSFADLFEALSIQLMEKGVNSASIIPAKEDGECTFENMKYYSHRKGDSERMVAFAIQR
ncbi:MAG: polyphenol oxidase family protein [Elusimicrobiota bacterium]